MTDRTLDDKPLKPYVVFRDVDGTEPLNRFDTLEEARGFIREHRHKADWQFVIRKHGRKIVWPEGRVEQRK